MKSHLSYTSHLTADSIGRIRRGHGPVDGRSSVPGWTSKRCWPWPLVDQSRMICSGLKPADRVVGFWWDSGQLIGFVGKNDRKSHRNHGKINGFRFRFSLKSTHWIKGESLCSGMMKGYWPCKIRGVQGDLKWLKVIYDGLQCDNWRWVRLIWDDLIWLKMIYVD